MALFFSKVLKPLRLPHSWFRINTEQSLEEEHSICIMHLEFINQDAQNRVMSRAARQTVLTVSRRAGAVTRKAQTRGAAVKINTFQMPDFLLQEPQSGMRSFSSFVFDARYEFLCQMNRCLQRRSGDRMLQK
jgi:hypothetical protein